MTYQELVDLVAKDPFAKVEVYRMSKDKSGYKRVASPKYLEQANIVLAVKFHRGGSLKGTQKNTYAGHAIEFASVVDGIQPLQPQAPQVMDRNALSELLKDPAIIQQLKEAGLVSDSKPESEPEPEQEAEKKKRGPKPSTNPLEQI